MSPLRGEGLVKHEVHLFQGERRMEVVDKPISDIIRSEPALLPWPWLAGAGLSRCAGLLAWAARSWPARGLALLAAAGWGCFKL